LAELKAMGFQTMCNAGFWECKKGKAKYVFPAMKSLQAQGTFYFACDTAKEKYWKYLGIEPVF